MNKTPTPTPTTLPEKLLVLSIGTMLFLPPVLGISYSLYIEQQQKQESRDTFTIYNRYGSGYFQALKEI